MQRKRPGSPPEGALGWSGQECCAKCSKCGKPNCYLFEKQLTLIKVKSTFLSQARSCDVLVFYQVPCAPATRCEAIFFISLSRPQSNSRRTSAAICQSLNCTRLSTAAGCGSLHSIGTAALHSSTQTAATLGAAALTSRQQHGVWVRQGLVVGSSVCEQRGTRYCTTLRICTRCREASLHLLLCIFFCLK